MIKAIVFDADDTLWSNEPLFRAAERNCFELLSQYGSREWLNDELYKTEMSNMAELGYGAKAFIISMIETAVRVSGGTVSADTILQIEQAGRAIMRNPAEPLPGVTEALTQIKKLDRYGLRHFFEFVDVVNEKTAEVYSELCARMGIVPEEMLMVGNSFKSDIDPVLRIGGYGIYIPSEMTWQHEIIDEYDHSRLFRAGRFSEIPGILEKLG